MNIPHIIGYLLSIKRPAGGGSLVKHGGSQTIIPMFPPNTQITLSYRLLGSDYFYIAYGFYIDPAVVPNAFTGWAQYYGNKVYEGVFNTAVMTWETQTFAFVSAAEPGLFMIQNNSPLIQYYGGFVYFVAIASEEDFDAVLSAIKEVGTSETNLLLSRLLDAKAGGA